MGVCRSPFRSPTEFMKTDNTMIKKEPIPNPAKIDRNEIAERAYKLWCGADRPVGRDLEFWLQAEAELLAAKRGPSPTVGSAGPDEGQRISGTQGRPKQRSQKAITSKIASKLGE